MNVSSSAPRRQPHARSRWRLLLFPLLVAAMVLALVAFYEAQSPTPWRTELDRYLALYNAESFTLIAAVSAKHPERMQRMAGFAPLDQSVYYRADASTTGELVGNDARRPLPYPPTAIQCVTLQDRRGERHLLLIARHADLYNADWLIHEATGDAEKTDHTLAAIECL